VLDPFVGSGTTGVVAMRLDRNFVGIELNQTYAEMARRRIGNTDTLFIEENVEPLTKIPTQPPSYVDLFEDIEEL
jgi:DNA modification methylase